MIHHLIRSVTDDDAICSRCGKLIKIKSKYDSSTKYCDSCAREMELEKTRLRVQKFREK